MSDGAPALELRNIARTFHQGASKIAVLDNANLALGRGEVVALTGPSGAGKSTLLQIAGLLEPPDAGDVLIDGESCASASDRRRTQIRGGKLGFVYQFHHLLPEFTALENVILPQMIRGTARRAATERARDLLDRMGLSEREKHRPARLSGGEQQRVAIARALANEPSVLLADEPTGNLDHTTASQVFEALMNIVRETGLAALVATHNPDLAGGMDRAVGIADGALSPADPSHH